MGGPVRVERRAAGDGDRQRKRSARQPLRQAEDVRHDIGLLACQQCACPAKPDHHLIRDEQDVVMRADAPHLGEEIRGLDEHAARGEDQGLDDKRRGLARPATLF